MKSAWLVAMALAVTAGAVWYFTREQEQLEAFRSREKITRVLAEYLAKRFAPERVLVISNPFTETGAPAEVVKMEQAGIKGLRKGFGRKTALKIVFPELKPGARTDPRSLLTDPETPTPMSYLLAEDAFDKLTPGYRLVISLIGLPAALDKVQCWQSPGMPAFALLLPDLRMIGNQAAVHAALKNGKLAALVVPKPGAHPKSKNEVLVVTPQNVDDLLKSFPTLLAAN